MRFNILLVEDSGCFRRTLADALSAHFSTINIAEAGNGQDALIKEEEFQPDMIFMDISLPGESGLEVTRKIKLKHEHTLIVMLTSYDIPEYRQQAFRNGADHFLCKTDDSCLTDVIAWVEKVMSDKNTQTGPHVSSVSRQERLRQRNRSTGACLPNAGLDLAACLP